MNSIVKKLYIGRCYVCGKPIMEDDMYGVMEDSDTFCCETCWYEYAERCDALMEQMKKEKAEPSTNENVESKCGKIDDKLFEKEWKRYMSSKKDDLSGRAVSVNVKDVARHFWNNGYNAKKEE